MLDGFLIFTVLVCGIAIGWLLKCDKQDRRVNKAYKHGLRSGIKLAKHKLDIEV